MPLICPTCQIALSDAGGPCYFAWGCFRYFWERARGSSSTSSAVAAQRGHSTVRSYGISRTTCSEGCGRTRCAEVSTRRRFRRVQRATRLRVLMRQHQSKPALLSGGGRRQLGRRMRPFTRDAEALFHLLAQLLECDVKHRHQEYPDRTRGQHTAEHRGANGTP